MQFIRKVSDYLTTWTPHPHPLPSSDSSSSSDARSDQSRRTEASSVRNAIVPTGPASPFTPVEACTQPASPTHSYAKRFRPVPKHQSLRQHLYQASPRPPLGMPFLPREGDPMRGGKHSQRTTDEQRLFRNPGERPDPNGVPIVPGQTRTKKKRIQNIGAFNPVDRISKKARESGPVRGHKKDSRPSNHQLDIAFSSPHPENATTPPERSSKRRRVEDLEAAPSKKRLSTDGSLEEHPAGVSPGAGNPNRMSPTQSQHIKSLKKQDSYYNVEKMMAVPRPQGHSLNPSPTKRPSSEDLDAFFTQGATRQRRTHSIISSANSESARHARPAQTSSFSVQKSSRSPSKSFAVEDVRPCTNGQRCVSDPRESPDELQGDATVKPVPKSLNRGLRKDASTRSELATNRLSQPTVLIPSTHEGNGISKGKKAKSNKKKSGDRHSFKITSFLAKSVMRRSPEGETDMLVVDTINDAIEFIKFGEKAKSFQIPLQKVLKVLVGTGESLKIRLELSKVEGQPTKVDIELSQSELIEDFCSLMRSQRIEVVDKSSGWMDKAFKTNLRNQKHGKEPTNGFKRTLTDAAAEESCETKAGVPKRVKISDSLRGKAGEATALGSLSLDTASIATANPSASAAKPNQTSKPEKASSHSPKPRHREGVEIPVKKYNPLQSSSRSTRSMARRATSPVFCDDDVDEDDCAPELKPEVQFAKWHKPLVYPRFGKKKAEVDAQDRERLRDNEFLNDNLIGFYMRFLEDHLERCNKEVAKRVYFFNSYFFATLTNLPRGKRGINYTGVQKWTRNVDIFSYDYIVVPINENAHWYVAIICNLPYLRGIPRPSMDAEDRTASRAPSEIREIPETPEPANPNEEGGDKASHQSSNNPEPTKEEVTRKSLASMSLFDKQRAEGGDTKVAITSDEDWPEREEDPGFSSMKSSDPASKPNLDSQKSSESTRSPQKSRKGKKRTAGIKHDPEQPIIITFDSLDVPRSPTISILREYLYEEATSKKGVEINRTLIKGMKAKDIPLQPNYWDCGLYLLAYVEKFVQDPDTFIRKLLQREMSSEHDWPRLRSGLLRKRLREFLEALYTEQEQLSPEKASQKTMVDQQPICYLLGPSKRAAVNAAGKPVVVGGVSSQSSESRNLLHAESTPSRSSPKPLQAIESPSSLAREASPGKTLTRTDTQQSVIEIEQLDQTDANPQAKDSPRRFPQREVVEVPDSQDPGNLPESPKPSILAQPDIPTWAIKSDPRYAQAYTVEDSDSAEETPAPTAKDRESGSGESVEVQIQVTRTPPRSP